jgi:hypothetical protein
LGAPVELASACEIFFWRARCPGDSRRARCRRRRRRRRRVGTRRRARAVRAFFACHFLSNNDDDEKSRANEYADKIWSRSRTRAWRDAAADAVAGRDAEEGGRAASKRASDVAGARLEAAALARAGAARRPRKRSRRVAVPARAVVRAEQQRMAVRVLRRRRKSARGARISQVRGAMTLRPLASLALFRGGTARASDPINPTSLFPKS